MNPVPAGEIGRQETDPIALESIIGTGMLETGIETMAEALAATANMIGDLPTCRLLLVFCTLNSCRHTMCIRGLAWDTQ